MPKHPLSLITFDIDDTLYASTDFARLARENAMTAMINASAFPDFSREQWQSMARDLYVQEGNVPVLE